MRFRKWIENDNPLASGLNSIGSGASSLLDKAGAPAVSHGTGQLVNSIKKSTGFGVPNKELSGDIQLYNGMLNISYAGGGKINLDLHGTPALQILQPQLAKLNYQAPGSAITLTGSKMQISNQKIGSIAVDLAGTKALSILQQHLG